MNLAAALMALAMLIVAARPADEMHAFGYSKAEYFSSGVEGAMIVVAAAIIAWTALPRLITPQPLEQVGIGLARIDLSGGTQLFRCPTFAYCQQTVSLNHT